MDQQWEHLAELLRDDPSGRGVAGLRPVGGTSAAEALRASAVRLLKCQAVGIVTGFYIPGAAPPAAETDGPPGALALARALQALGRQVHLITDPYAAPLLAAGLHIYPTRGSTVPFIHCVPWDGDSLPNDTTRAVEWLERFWHEHVRSFDALVSIERNGASHTSESVLTSPEDVAHFADEVPVAHRNCRHNMRGEIIDRFTPPLELLFERVRYVNAKCFTLGIGDGGNEIGMGCFPWRQLRDSILRGPAALIPCRIATDEVITAGISNWGAYAVIIAMATLEPQLRLSDVLSVAGERKILESLVAAGAVDGVALRREPTVDGVPTDTYLAHLEAMIACADG